MNEEFWLRWPVRKSWYWQDLGRLLALLVMAVFGALLLGVNILCLVLAGGLLTPELMVLGMLASAGLAIWLVKAWRENRFEPEASSPERGEFEGKLARIEEYAAALATQNEELERELADALAELKTMRVMQGQAAPEGDYAAVKRAFVKRYHPDMSASASKLAPNAREKVFRDFYPVFEELERSGRR